MDASITYTMLSGCYGDTWRTMEASSDSHYKSDVCVLVACSGTHHGIGDLQHLFKQRVFLFMSSAGVNDDDFEILGFELVNTLRGDDHRVHLCVTEHNTQP